MGVQVTEKVDGKFVDDAGNCRNKEYFDILWLLICAINYAFRLLYLPLFPRP